MLLLRNNKMRPTIKKTLARTHALNRKCFRLNSQRFHLFRGGCVTYAYKTNTHTHTHAHKTADKLGGTRVRARSIRNANEAEEIQFPIEFIDFGQARYGKEKYFLVSLFLKKIKITNKVSDTQSHLLLRIKRRRQSRKKSILSCLHHRHHNRPGRSASPYSSPLCARCSQKLARTK